jgi:hypothetical protein
MRHFKSLALHCFSLYLHSEFEIGYIKQLLLKLMSIGVVEANEKLPAN